MTACLVFMGSKQIVPIVIMIDIQDDDKDDYFITFSPILGVGINISLLDDNSGAFLHHLSIIQSLPTMRG